ncbi:hypothetical protein ACLESO_24425 [Pyxidicoccus sp. 3LG]
MRGILAALVLTVACGEGVPLGAAEETGEAEAGAEETATFGAVLFNEGPTTCTVGLTYWMVRSADYGTNWGWQPLVNQPPPLEGKSRRS